jgi:hypothetical protein
VAVLVSDAKVEDAIRRHLSAGNGILKVAALVGVGSGTVQRVKREMAGELAKAACTPTIVSCAVRDRLAIGKSRPFRREVAARSR